MSDKLKTYHLKSKDNGFSSLQFLRKLDPFHMHNTCLQKTLHKHLDLLLMSSPSNPNILTTLTILSSSTLYPPTLTPPLFPTLLLSFNLPFSTTFPLSTILTTTPPPCSNQHTPHT